MRDIVLGTVGRTHTHIEYDVHPSELNDFIA